MAISGEGITIPFEIDFADERTEIEEMLQSRRAAKQASTDFISFIIPTYNEEETIFCNLLECLAVVRKLGLPFEIIVVNDGSTDNNLLEIERAAEDHPEIVLVTYAKNVGKGNAIKAGVRRACGNLVVFLDADLEIHPSQTAGFIQRMGDTGADVVIGSKRHPESKIDYPTKRKFLSWGYHLLIKTMFDLDVTDTQPGFKLFRKEVLEKEMSKVMADRYAFDLDLLVNASADGYKIVEAPIELKFSRNFGGRLGFRTIKSILVETLSIFYRQKVRKRKTPALNAITSKADN